MNLGFVFVPFPREIWEQQLDLSQAEFRLLGWFLCNLKFGLAQLEVTDDQLLNGFRGERCSYPPLGISRNAMKTAREGLINKGMIVAEPAGAGAGGRGKSAQWKYILNLSNSDTFISQTCQTLTINPSNSDTIPQALIKEEREVQRTTKEKQPSPPRKVVATTSIPPWLDAETWAAFCEMRKGIKHPMSAYAEKLILKKLAEFEAKGIRSTVVLERSIVNGWRDVFAPEPSNGNFRTAPPPVKLVETEFKL